MPTPLPDRDSVLLLPPDADEAQFLVRGIVSAITPECGMTPLQRVLVEATAESLTGHRVAIDIDPIEPDAFAAGMSRRTAWFRNRILQKMILGALVLRPLPPEVSDRLDRFAEELSVGDDMLTVAHDLAAGSYGLAALDFDRAGYTKDWATDAHDALHTSTALASAWDLAVHDDELAARWRDLEHLPPGTLGRRLTEFYRARGFHYPGTPGSVPPLLAQHDWVHLVADYGTQVESELEVFAFIAEANADPRGFSLLAMVVSLFETGALPMGAGVFEAFPGQLSHDGVAIRLADALRRGGMVEGGVDFLAVDWFDLAPLPVEAVREHFGVVPKSAAALAAGSVGPWESGGLSPFQEAAGRDLATLSGHVYDSFGASTTASPPTATGGPRITS